MSETSQTATYGPPTQQATIKMASLSARRKRQASDGVALTSLARRKMSITLEVGLLAPGGLVGSGINPPPRPASPPSHRFSATVAFGDAHPSYSGASASASHRFPWRPPRLRCTGGHHLAGFTYSVVQPEYSERAREPSSMDNGVTFSGKGAARARRWRPATARRPVRADNSPLANRGSSAASIRWR